MKRKNIKYCLLAIVCFAQMEAGVAQNVRIKESEIQLQDKYLEAVGQQQIGKPDAASKLFAEVLEKNPKCDACAFQMARLYETMGKRDDALSAVKKAASLDAKNKWYKMLYADLLEKTGKDKEASEVYRSLTQTENFDEEAYYHLAYSLLRAGEPDKALKIYDDLEKHIGIDEDLIHKKYDVYLATGDAKKAGQELKKLSESNPQNVEYLYLLAEFYQKNGQKAEETAVFKNILKLDPNDAKANIGLTSTSRKPSAQNEQAYLASLKDLFAKPDVGIDLKIKELLPYIAKVADKNDQSLGLVCLDLARTIERAHPTEAKSYAMVGDLLYHTGRPLEALDQYKQCVKINKNVYAVWEQMLFIYEENGLYDDLLATSENLTDLFPNNPVPFYFNGLANEKKGKWNDAIVSLSQASLMSVRKPALKLDILVEMGVAYSRSKEFDKADKSFDEALKLIPGSPVALIKKGYSLSLREGQAKEARAAADKALAVGGDKIPAVLESYGDTLFKLGDAAGAVAYWQKAKDAGSKSKGLDKKIAERSVLE